MLPYDIHSLPNEILIQILNPFSTRALLPLASTSARFSALILRILHIRLSMAASLPSYKLILEAHHPTCKYRDPYLFCHYLGTPGLLSHEGGGPLHENVCKREGYARLNQLYSRFRPEKPGVEGSMPRRPYPVDGSVNPVVSGSISQPVYTNDGDGGIQKVEHTINLDSHELFSQFCTIANLVKIGPRRGVFLSIVNVEEKVMRVWRKWLDARALETTRENQDTEAITVITTAAEKPKNKFADPETPIQYSPSVLWTDCKRNVGLLVRIKERRYRGTQEEVAAAAATATITSPSPSAIAIPPVEEQPASYSIEIQELIVRTTHLMLAVEQSIDQQEANSSATMFWTSCY